jgi:hypothetical protein
LVVISLLSLKVGGTVEFGDLKDAMGTASPLKVDKASLAQDDGTIISVSPVPYLPVIAAILWSCLNFFCDCNAN